MGSYPAAVQQLGLSIAHIGSWLWWSGLPSSASSGRSMGAAGKVIACIEDPTIVKRILDHLIQREGSTRPLRHATRAPPLNIQARRIPIDIATEAARHWRVLPPRSRSNTTYGF